MEQNRVPEQMKLCPNCGAKCKTVYKYCNECGAVLSDNVASSTGVSNGFVPQNGTDSFTPAPPITPNMESVSAEQMPLDEQIPPFVPQAEAAPAAEPVAEPQPATPAEKVKAEPVTNEVPTSANAVTANTAPTAKPNMNTFFDGVSVEDMFIYTGKKPKLYEKIQQQQMNPMGKIFCVPLFLLGLFFGFFGMACWYLYHKLYKLATLFFVLTAVFFTVNMVASYDMMEMVADFIEELAGGSALADNTTDMLVTSTIASTISSFGNLAQFALAIIMPFYAYNTYRTTAIERIRKAYMSPFTPNIAAVGGTAKGLLAVAIVVAVIAFIVSFVVLLTPVLEKAIEMAVEAPAYLEQNDFYEFYGDFNY